MCGLSHGKGVFLAWMLVLTAGGSKACATPLAAGAGYDYQNGPADETWSAPLAFVTAAVDRGDATLSLSRYHSSEVGWGWNGGGNVGISLGSHAGARAIGIRSIGDGDYRAWRLQAGPTLKLDESRSLFFYGAHFEDNGSARLNQIGAETSFPVVAQLSGVVGAALGEWQASQSSAQGSAGVVWSRWKELQLIGQATFGKNIAGLSSGGSGGAGAGPLGGGGRGHQERLSAGSTSSLEAAAFAAIRLMVP